MSVEEMRRELLTSEVTCLPNRRYPVPACLTEFENQIKRLGLSRADYVRSVELKLWCQRNRNRVYIPKWLLKEWGMSVEDTFSGVA
jgi:hypothetical protein